MEARLLVQLSPIGRTTAIGLLFWMLRLLPRRQEQLKKCIGTPVAIGLLYMATSALGDPISGVELSVGLAAPPLSLVLILAGTWVRKQVDQRFTSTAQRLERLHELRRITSRAHDSRPGEIVLRDVDSPVRELFQFPDPSNEDGLLTVATELNCAAFASTPFRDSFEAKLDRNGSHLLRNPYTIMLMAHEEPSGQRGAEKNQHVGFTHLIPVTHGTYKRYVRGEIGDNDFDSDLVCQPYEEAYAIIIFSLGLDRWRLKEILQERKLSGWDRFLARVGIAPAWIDDMYEAEQNLWWCFVEHVTYLMAHQRFVDFPVTLVAQSLNRKVEKNLKAIGFAQLPGTSKDDEHLYTLKAWPPEKRSSRRPIRPPAGIPII